MFEVLLIFLHNSHIYVVLLEFILIWINISEYDINFKESMCVKSNQKF